MTPEELRAVLIALFELQGQEVPEEIATADNIDEAGKRAVEAGFDPAVVTAFVTGDRTPADFGITLATTPSGPIAALRSDDPDADPLGDALGDQPEAVDLEGLSDAELRARAAPVDEIPDLFLGIDPNVNLPVDERGHAVPPQYEVMDDFNQFVGLAPEAVAAIQLEMMDALLLQAGDFAPGLWDGDTQETMRNLMTLGNQTGRSWEESLEFVGEVNARRLAAGATIGRVGGGGGGGRLLPDWATIRQGVKSEMGRILGREPTDAELTMLSDGMMADASAGGGGGTTTSERIDENGRLQVTSEEILGEAASAAQDLLSGDAPSFVDLADNLQAPLGITRGLEAGRNLPLGVAAGLDAGTPDPVTGLVNPTGADGERLQGPPSLRELVNPTDADGNRIEGPPTPGDFASVTPEVRSQLRDLSLSPNTDAETRARIDALLNLSEEDIAGSGGGRRVDAAARLRERIEELFANEIDRNQRVGDHVGNRGLLMRSILGLDGAFG